MKKRHSSEVQHELPSSNDGLSQKDEQRLVPTPFHSAFALEAAVYALRMVEGAQCHARLLAGDTIRDWETLNLMGLETRPGGCGGFTPASLRGVFGEHLKQLERRLRCVDTLARNIENLGKLLRLNLAERAVLRLAAIAGNVKHFDCMFRYVLTSRAELMRGLQAATNLQFSKIMAVFLSARALPRSGFFMDLGGDWNSSPLQLSPWAIDALLTPNRDEKRILRFLVRTAPASSLSIADFEHLPDLPILKRYLSDASARRKRGVNILLYGAPGTGKTELVRALGPALGLKTYEVPNEDCNGEPISGRRRFTAYAMCQDILASCRKQLLMFDEVEDVFGGESTGLARMLGIKREMDAEGLRKSWINETLENNAVPAVWVCNSVGGIDPAFLPV